MEDAGVLDLPGLSLPPESRYMPRRIGARGFERALRDLIVPGVGGRRVFRLFISEACKHSCEGCPMAAARELGLLGEPRRLARAFVASYRRGWCDGVFVTAGVPKSATWAMEKILEVVETLRYTLGFRGYVHVKVPGGAEPRQLSRLMGLVDRVSFQLEPACARAERAEEPLSVGAGGSEATEEIEEMETTSHRTAAMSAPRRYASRTSSMTRRVDPTANTGLSRRVSSAPGGLRRERAARPEPRQAFLDLSGPFRKGGRNR